MTAVEDAAITEAAAAEPEPNPKKRVSPKLADALAAARNEGDDDDDAAKPDDDDDAPTPAPEPEPELPPTERTLEEISAAAEAENERHLGELMAILGGMAVDYDLCYCCTGAGLIDKNAAGNMPAEQLAAIKLQTVGPEVYNDDPEFAACERCSGKGRLRTKGEVADQLTAPCPTCIGKGWLTVVASPSPQAFFVPDPTYAATTTTNVASPPPPLVNINVPPPGWPGPTGPGADAWGRWPGHSRFGIDPANGGW